ncbi:DNA-binding response regulator [Komagataeibacter xylinus]|uniref:response regulator transcription factor n=1 Tax=Komagataeibacter xylinus TaxID=28448 RepID=UPI00102F524B|nr:DNA-binding response regulator [Komagataeibacter xylinus]
MTGIILVIDDAPDNLALISDILESGQYTPLVSTSAEQAFSILPQIEVDLILLDAVMPGTDGFQACQQIKNQAQYAHIPVIFMTGLSEQQHIVQAFNAGSVDYIIKPVQPAELLARVRTHLKNARKAHHAFRALNFSGRHFLATDPAGHSLWFTPHVPAMLEYTLHEGAPALPGDMQKWLLNCISQPDQVESQFFYSSRKEGENSITLSFMGQQKPGEFLVRLAVTDANRNREIIQKTLKLTAREAEVIIWLAQGKTYRDIADILSISPRTVNKHLEQSYVKIGVENRASATARVLQVLQK